MLWSSFVHVHETEAQQIFAGEDVDAWEVTDFLEKLQFDEQLRFDMVVSPQDVPGLACLHLSLYFPLELFCDVFDDFIVGYWVFGGVRARLMVMGAFGGGRWGVFWMMIFFFLCFLGDSSASSSLSNSEDSYYSE